MAQPGQPCHQVRFGEFQLDLQTAELCSNGHKTTLQDHPFQVLVLLLEHQGQLVTRDELTKKLWAADTFVDFDQGLNKAVNRLREALGDSAEGPRFIETFPRRGYRFIAPVQKVTANGTNSQTVAAPLSNLIGKKVSHYRVLEILGGGGMGLVYKAEDLKLGRRVALKFLPEELVHDPVALERFEREARATSALNHSNICTTYAVEEHNGQPFLAMEFLEGETLRELISSAPAPLHPGSSKGGPLALNKLLDTAIQVAEGLEAAHERGIIHRDIKPANIFLTRQGRVKILDFGLAKLQGIDAPEQLSPVPDVNREWNPNLTLTSAGVAIGTAGYMSPEQVRGEKLDGRTDLFSFGTVLYEMATGKRAFAGHTAPILREAIVNTVPTPARELNPELSVSLELIIERALEKNRDRRYQSACELRADLQRLLRDTQIAAQPEHAEHLISKRIWSLAVASVATVLLLLLWKWVSPNRRGISGSRDKKVLAVVEVENFSQDPSLSWLGNGVVDLITTDLAQARNLEVISSERVRSLVGRETKTGDSLPASRAQQVAQEVGADIFVSGGILRMAQGFRLDLRVQDTATGKVLVVDRVEGDTPQAIFSMVDRSTARIVSQLTPQAPALQPSAANLTANFDALRAYEEGINYLDRGFNDKASDSLRRATKIDPEFAMAYFYLAQRNPDSGEAREALSKAARLAERQNLPEQQKLIIRATEQTEVEGEGATQTFETIVRLFPREIEPRIHLGALLKYEGRLSESAAVLEEAAQFDDPKRPTIYNSLAYTRAYQGDLPRALAAVDTYAALLPPNDPNPIDTRADIYALGGQFDKAIAEYEKNIAWHPEFSNPELKMALVYLLEGKYRKAEEIAQSAYRKASGSDPNSDLTATPLAATVLGDIAVGRGELSRAVSYFTESARLFGDDQPGRVRRELWKGAEIYFEQGEPESALAWASRTPNFGSAEIRGVAYLVLKNQPAAEKEFAAARSAMAPVFGDHITQKVIAFDRLRAASYSSQWQHVITSWKEFSPSPVNSFYPGRAYAEMAMWPEAEAGLRSALIYVGPGNLISSYSDFFHDVLTKFYLGRVLEQEGKNAEAIETYRAFLSHFEHTTARLPQIAEAQAALHRLK